MGRYPKRDSIIGVYPTVNKPVFREIRVMNYLEAENYVVEKHNVPTFRSIMDLKDPNMDPNRDSPSRALWLMLCEYDYVRNGNASPIDFYDWYESEIYSDASLADQPAYKFMKLLIDEFELDKEENTDIWWEFYW